MLEDDWVWKGEGCQGRSEVFGVDMGLDLVPIKAEKVQV